MKREIEFRGFDGAEWVYGSAILNDDSVDAWYLIEHGSVDDDWIMIGHVGQCIGLKDINGKKIYEGDNMKFYHLGNNPDTYDIAPVLWFGDSDWNYPAFDLDANYIKEHHFDGNALSEIVSSGLYHYEVIGTVYDEDLDRI